MEDAENKQLPKKADFIWIKRITKLLDSQFPIPGTNHSIGIDPIIGLIPLVGDIVTFIVSAMLIFHMARHGASLKLVLKMMFNSGLDLLIGGIPVAGQIGDFMLKANERNLRLFIEFHEEKKHQGHGLGFLLIVLLLLIAIPLVFAVLAWKFFAALGAWIFGG